MKLSSNLESGHSMVEMLGVLGIIGVLSVGGVAGYRYGMSKIAANTIMKEVSIDAVIISPIVVTNGVPDTFDLPQMTYNISYFRETNESYFLSVSGLTKDVCEMTLKLGVPQWAESVRANRGKGCQAGGANEIAFFVNANLSKESSNEDRYEPCEKDDDCGDVCGICGEEKYCLDDDSLCTDPAKPYCSFGVCVSEMCGYDEVLSGNVCQSCDDSAVSFGNISRENCMGGCKGKRFPQKTSCIRCDAPWTAYYYVYREDCLACGNRWTTAKPGEQGTCDYCPGMVTADGLCDFDCPTGEFGTQSECKSCDDSTIAFGSSTRETCMGGCKGKRFPQGTSCIRCDSPGTAYYYVYREDCLACGNRWWNKDGQADPVRGTCGYCGAGKYNANDSAMNAAGCLDCPADRTTLTLEKHCTACGGTWFDGGCL